MNQFPWKMAAKTKVVLWELLTSGILDLPVNITRTIFVCDCVCISEPAYAAGSQKFDRFVQRISLIPLILVPVISERICILLAGPAVFASFDEPKSFGEHSVCIKQLAVLFVNSFLPELLSIVQNGCVHCVHVQNRSCHAVDTIVRNFKS